jgi:hypothetical protein
VHQGSGLANSDCPDCKAILLISKDIKKQGRVISDSHRNRLGGLIPEWKISSKEFKKKPQKWKEDFYKVIFEFAGSSRDLLREEPLPKKRSKRKVMVFFLLLLYLELETWCHWCIKRAVRK